MSCKACAFNSATLRARCVGAEAAGVKIGRVEIEPNTGRISIVPASVSSNDGELDRELVEFEARHGQS